MKIGETRWLSANAPIECHINITVQSDCQQMQSVFVTGVPDRRNLRDQAQAASERKNRSDFAMERM